MSRDYSLREIIAGLDPITDGQPQGIRKTATRLRWEQGRQGAGPLSYRSLRRTVGGESMGQTLRAIDGSNPPASLRQAYDRMGFPVGGGVTRLPDGPVSLRKIARRIIDPDVVPIRFLSYNTYLLPGLQIPLGRWIDDAVGWDALAWFGIPHGGALLAALGLSSVPGVALFTILKMAGFTPSKVIKEITGADLNGVMSFEAKPALKERSQFLGPTLGVYDVCCLCEVNTEDSRQEILSRLELTSGGAPFAFTTGPDESGAWSFLSSGLLFLARKNRRIVKTEILTFDNRGSRIRDPDAWANKGILLNVIDLGFGQLEIFQTHFFYGGGMPMQKDPTDKERMDVWRAELAELANFYRRHHQDENVALITGDFNMNGANVSEYAEMRRTMDSLNMRDLWAWDIYENNPGEGNTCRFTDGPESGWQREFKGDVVGGVWGGVCKPLEQPDRQGQWRHYCDDRVFHTVPPRGVGRFDYIFAENPTASHGYHLEVSRILRRPFPLPRKIKGEKYLSDHLALELTLYCSRRD
jgi:hypothetical protein